MTPTVVVDDADVIAEAPGFGHFEFEDLVVLVVLASKWSPLPAFVDDGRVRWHCAGRLAAQDLAAHLERALCGRREGQEATQPAPVVMDRLSCLSEPPDEAA